VFWYPRAAHSWKIKRFKTSKVESLYKNGNKFKKRPSRECVLFFSWRGSINFCFWLQKSSDWSWKIGLKPAKGLVWTFFWVRNSIWADKKENTNHWANSHKKQAAFHSQKEIYFKLIFTLLLRDEKRGTLPESRWNPDSLFYYEKRAKTQIFRTIRWLLSVESKSRLAEKRRIYPLLFGCQRVFGFAIHRRLKFSMKLLFP